MSTDTSAEWHEGPAPSAKKRRDFYQKLRTQIREWAAKKDNNTHKASELILAAPDLFHLLCKLIADPRVPASEKTKLGLVIAYFISPIDLMPEALLGPIGYADDVALAAMVLNGMIGKVDVEVLREHWAGEEDVLLFLHNMVAMLDDKVNQGVLRKLRRMVGRH